MISCSGNLPMKTNVQQSNVDMSFIINYTSIYWCYKFHHVQAFCSIIIFRRNKLRKENHSITVYTYYFRDLPFSSEYIHVFLKPRNVPLDTSNALLTTMPNFFAQSPKNFTIIRSESEKKWKLSERFISTEMFLWTGGMYCLQPCRKCFAQSVKKFIKMHFSPICS